MMYVESEFGDQSEPGTADNDDDTLGGMNRSTTSRLKLPSVGSPNGSKVSRL